KVLLFSASNSSQSINQTFIEHIAQYIHQHEVTIIDLRFFPAPLYSYDIEQKSGKPSAMMALHNLFSSHDAFIIATPEHNGALPAFFKNIVDWLSRIEKKIFQQKPVILFSVTPGAGGSKLVLQHATDLIPRWGGNLQATIGIPNYIDFENFETYFQANQTLLSHVQKTLQLL
ncbi:MAG TPA: NAD(P)H-dependent oxidoreductase, partial [Bacteroidales bacterium]|nr:NAD(P)H-dependent oxidoreductase [Bacteroidales bacterium]